MKFVDSPRWRSRGLRWMAVGFPVLAALAVIMTLYFAPTKDSEANLLLLLVSVVAIATRRFHWVHLRVFAVLWPLALLAAYALLLDIFFPLADATGLIHRLCLGAGVFWAFYLLFATMHMGRRYLWLLFVFVAPAVVHLLYMYADIAAWVLEQDMVNLEHVKDVPRVGRRYLSHALIPLLFTAVLFGPRLRPVRWLPLAFWLGIGLPALSLALLDARAAYAALLGAALVVAVVPPMRREFRNAGRRWSRRMPSFGGMLLVVVAATLLLGYSAGKSRWVAMGHSFIAAVSDVRSGDAFRAKKPPFADMQYWSRSAEARCVENPGRCEVDQSMYLRAAWMLHALNQLKEYPFGIGQRASLMSFDSAQTSDASDRSQNTAGDNFLIEAALAFGFVGLAVYGWFWWSVIQRGVSAVVQHKRKALYVLLTTLIGIGILRGFVDVVSFGIWYYWLGMVGVLCGCLYQDRLAER